jgi:hypothetical protein
MMTFIEYQDYMYLLTGVHHSGNSLHSEYGHYVQRVRNLMNSIENAGTKRWTVEKQKKILHNRCKCSICKDIIEK